MKKLEIQLVLMLFIVAFAGQSLAATGANPEINRPFMDPDFSIWRKRFESAGREVYDQRHKIVSALAVKRGQSVADIGAGTGLFTWLFSEKVGRTGKVYAIDISDKFIERIRKDARQRGLDNITGIINTQDKLSLPNQSIDLAFICDTYHHFEKPDVMLQKTHGALKQYGRLVVIDYKKQNGVSSEWVMQHVRADKDRVIHEISAQGFRLVKEFDILKANYFLVFEKIW